MNASIVDIRRRMREVLAALDRNEPVTIYYRGRKKAVLIPADRPRRRVPVSEHPAFGMWRDREDMQDVDAYMRAIRQDRNAV